LRYGRPGESYEVLDPQQLFDRVLLSPLDWPGKTMRLEADSLLDYRNRPASSHASLAEMYHENSKLFPEISSRLAASIADSLKFRIEFVHRRARVALRGSPTRLSSVPQVARLLRTVAQLTPPELFYAVELRVVADRAVAIHEPVNDLLPIVKKIAAEERGTLRSALGIDGLDAGAGDRPLICIVASFARNDMLWGLRGYRRTLVECGRVAETLVKAATASSLDIRIHTEFTDRLVDSLVEADGVEEGTVVVIEVDCPVDDQIA
jgi:hypothetical protein